MNPLRGWCARRVLAGTILLVWQSIAPAQGGAAKPEATKWLFDRTLTISAAPVPEPLLKYRLYPLASELKDGNAVPIYLRLKYEAGEANRTKLAETLEKWNRLPPDRIPLSEAREFLHTYRYYYRQLDLGARRKTAEWNYTLDEGSIVDIRLPDVQAMRGYVPMLTLKARVEAAEGKYADAIHTLETAFSFSQHLSRGPFLISGLVGIACAVKFSDTVSDLIELPGSPNLYWALTAMPRPFIDLRKAFEFEQRLPQMQFPVLGDVEQTRTAGDWDTALRRMRSEFRRICPDDVKQKPLAAGLAPEDPATRSPDLPTAKKYLVERAGMTAATVEAMPAAQVLLTWIAYACRAIYDDGMKSIYLPFPQALRVPTGIEHQTFAPSDSEAARIANGLFPSARKVMLAGIRTDRKLALLTVVEALRLHLAGNGGQLPDRLDQVTAVPIPDDPGTGKPFTYERNGLSATITGVIPGDPDSTRMRIKLTIRKSD